MKTSRNGCDLQPTALSRRLSDQVDRHQAEARDGDTMLARIGDEVALKRFQRAGPTRSNSQPESTNLERASIRPDLRTEDLQNRRRGRRGDCRRTART